MYKNMHTEPDLLMDDGLVQSIFQVSEILQITKLHIKHMTLCSWEGLKLQMVIS